MEGSKIHLSVTELNLVQNADIILTKNTIIKKTIALLEELQEQMMEEKKNIFSSDILSVSPKISKGENYLGLPYVVLDYPRFSQNENLCFIRSMFWWGNYFSSTLQLSGTYSKQFQEKILLAYEELSGNDYYIGVHANPWQHHFEQTNYRKIDSIKKEDFAGILQQQQHIKIAAKWPLDEWNLAAMHLYESWNRLMALIT